MEFATISAGAVAPGREALNAATRVFSNDDQKGDQVGESLENTARKLGGGEAAMAGGLGHQLCRCQFPPTPMLKVGHLPHARLNGIDSRAAMARQCKDGGSSAGAVAVHACPRCKQTDAPAYPDFVRDREADPPLPLLAAPPVQSKQPAPRSFQDWGW